MAESKAFELNPFAAPKEGAAFWNFGLQQLQAGLKAQAEFLGNLQSATENCLRHRRQNVEDAATAVGRMCECKDAGEAAAIQQKWLSDFAQSLMEDFTALSGTAAAAARGLGEQRQGREIKVAKVS